MNIRGYLWHLVQTTAHKFWVARYLLRYVQSGCHDAHRHLLWRALTHDLSKYRWSEARHFAQLIFASATYGTDAYRRQLVQLRPAVALHYRRNQHHPEYHPDGFHGMSRDDLIEMVADWIAAARRHRDGNVFKSIEFNQQRFGYSDHVKHHLISMAQIMQQP